MNYDIKQQIFARCVEEDGPLDTKCPIWTGGKNNKGYGHIGKNSLVHRLAYQFCVGPIPKGMWVLHECYQPDCCNPEHLKLGTVQDNADDRVRHGRSCAGEEQYFAILKRHQVVEILKMANDGKSFAHLSRRFGVCIQTIADIAYGRTWRAVPGPRLLRRPRSAKPLNVIDADEWAEAGIYD